MRRHAVASVLACALQALGATAMAASNTHVWSDWLGSTGGGADGGNGLVAGELTLGSEFGSIGYTGPFLYTVFGPGWFVEWTSVNWTQNNVIGNRPPPTDAIGLQGGPGTGKITFDQPVINPVMSIISLGLATNDGRFFPAEMVFAPGVTFEVLNSSSSIYGYGGPLTISGQTLRGTESSGSIRFLGAYQTIEWTTPLQEREAPELPIGGAWGFTVGAPCFGGFQVGPAPLTVAAAIPSGCSAENKVTDSWQQKAALNVRGEFTNRGTHEVLAPLTVETGGHYKNLGPLIVPAGQTVSVQGRFESLGFGSGESIFLRGVMEFNGGLASSVRAPLYALDTARVLVENGSSLELMSSTFSSAAKLETRGLGSVAITGSVTFQDASMMEVGVGSSVAVRNGGVLTVKDQASLVNRGNVTIEAGYLNVDSRLLNHGLVALSEAAPAMGGPGFLNIAGTFENLASATFTATGGRVNVYGLLKNQGRIELSGGQHTVDTGGVFAQEGRLGLTGAGTDLSSFGSVIQTAGALTVLGSGARFDSAGSYQNAGTLILAPTTRLANTGEFLNQHGGRVLLIERTSFFDDHATFENLGNFLNQGRLEIGGVFENLGTFEQSGAGIIHFAHGTMIAYDFVMTGGSITGTGIIDGNVTMTGGAIAPGSSPGRVDITGNLQMTAGTLEFEIARYGPSDELRVGGFAQIFDARINVSFLDGLAPDLDQTFDLITSLAGTTYFAGVQWQVGDGTLDYLESSFAGQTLSLVVQPFNAVRLTVLPNDVWTDTFVYIDSDLGRSNFLQVQGTLGIRRGGRGGWDGVDIYAGGRMLNSGDVAITHALAVAGEFVNRGTTSVGTVAVQPGGVFRNTGNLTLTGEPGASPTFRNQGSVHHMSGHWLNSATGAIPSIQNDAGATFRISATMSGAATFRNAGDLWIDRDGRVQDLAAFVQDAGRTRVDGTLIADSISVTGGIVEGHGRIEGPVTIAAGYDGAGAWQRPVVRGGTEAEPGALTFAGNATLVAASEGVILEFLIASASSFSSLHFENVEFGSGTSLRFVLVGGFEPQGELTLPVMSWNPTGTVSGVAGLYQSFGVFRRSASGDTYWPGPQFVRDEASVMSLLLAPVPEPGTWAMMFAGLVLVFGATRRRRPTSS